MDEQPRGPVCSCRDSPRPLPSASSFRCSHGRNLKRFHSLDTDCEKSTWQGAAKGSFASAACCSTPPYLNAAVINQHIIHFEVCLIAFLLRFKLNKGVLQTVAGFVIANDFAAVAAAAGGKEEGRRREQREGIVSVRASATEENPQWAVRCSHLLMSPKREKINSKSSSVVTGCSLHTNNTFLGGSMSASGMSPSCSSIVLARPMNNNRNGTRQGSAAASPFPAPPPWTSLRFL